MIYLILSFLHVIGANVILGTGIGTAFFMFMAHRSGDSGHIARTATTVVLADGLFTGIAVIAQPVTGALPLRETGLPVAEGWLLVSLALYGLAGAFWPPMVWMQARMRDLGWEAAAKRPASPGALPWALPALVLCRIPGFGCVLVILWLMVAKPSF